MSTRSWLVATLFPAAVLCVGGAIAARAQDAYPPRPPADPAVLERGKALYGANCAFCHGPDARGGSEGGPNLLRSQLVLGDENGEKIGEVVLNGRPGTSMPAFKLTQEQVSDVAAFIHSFRVAGYDATRNPPVSIVVGNAAAGQAAFQARCASCHSTTGDLAHVAARFPDPRDLQQAWLLPSAGGRGRGQGAGANVPPTTATVTTAAGGTFEGRLVRIDDFVVTLEQPEGTPRSFTRHGDAPRIEVHDPLAPHRALLPQYTDAEIHDITAFLVTLK
jgi:mono/diheme cytochrome c family protein